MRDAGIDSLGMHLEAVEPRRPRADHAGQGGGAGRVLLRGVRGRGRGLRPGPGQHLHPGRTGRFAPTRSSATCERLIAAGVYPFVVPFVPISGTPLESHPAPPADFMRPLLRELGAMLDGGGAAVARHQGRLRQVRRLLVAVGLREAARPRGPANDAADSPARPAATLRGSCRRRRGRRTAGGGARSFPREAWRPSRGSWRGTPGCGGPSFAPSRGCSTDTDRDDHDEAAQPIVAVSYAAGMADEVVGAVRIYEDRAAGRGTWYGSRLAVARDWRGVPDLAAGSDPLRGRDGTRPRLPHVPGHGPAAERPAVPPAAVAKPGRGAGVRPRRTT